MAQHDAQHAHSAWVKVLMCEHLDDVHAQLAQLDPAYDWVEWRLDVLSFVPSDDVMRAVMRAAPVPVMLTLRTTAHGGQAHLGAQAYADAILRLAQLAPAYLDCESHLSDATLDTICACAPQTRIVRSHHFLSGPPACWSSALQAMRHDGVYVYKLVAGVLSTAQALQQLTWLQQHAHTTPLIVHAMSHTFSRVLAPLMGSRVVYFLDQHGPGGLDLMSAKVLYRMRSHCCTTHIYALLGDPVEHSMGHVVHNRWFGMTGVDAVYVKMAVQVDDWHACWAQLVSWERFKGASVTTPLKTVMSAVAQEGDALHAVNTLVRCPTSASWLGHQTDGVGAHDALEQWLDQTRRILMVGGGGANRAIALYLRRCGHEVTVLQRRAGPWSAWFVKHNIDVMVGVSASPDVFDVVIYGVPPDAFIDASWQAWLAVLNPRVTMDLSYGRSSPWLRWVQQHWPYAVAMDGQALFMGQAKAQQRLWQAAMTPFGQSGVVRNAEAMLQSSMAHITPTLVKRK